MELVYWNLRIRDTTLLFILGRTQFCLKNCWTTLQTFVPIISQQDWKKTSPKLSRLKTLLPN